MANQDDEFLRERRAAILESKSNSQAGEVDTTGESNGGRAYLPSLPASGRRETVRVAGDGEGPTGHPVGPKSGRRAVPGEKSVQVRLRLPDEFVSLLRALPPGHRAVALWLALEGRLGNASNWSAVITSTAQMRWLGVLLNQCCQYFGSGQGGSASLKIAVKQAVRDIRKLRPRKSVRVRLRLPSDFANLLLTLPPNHRWVTLWIALDSGIGAAWNLPEVILNATELQEMGALLNQLCLQFGRGNGDLKLLESNMNETLRVINKLRPPSINTERKESENESDH